MPMGKNTSGSTSRQAARSRQSVPAASRRRWRRPWLVSFIGPRHLSSAWACAPRISVVTPRLSKCFAQLAACHQRQRPSLPPASRTGSIPASCNARCFPPSGRVGSQRVAVKTALPSRGRSPDLPANARSLMMDVNRQDYVLVVHLPNGCGEGAARWPAVHCVCPRIRPIARADSSDFARNPAAGLSAINSA